MSGRIPDIFAEIGIRAELRYNRAGLIRKAAVASVVVGAAISCSSAGTRAYRF
jgi:hypothetical protein